MVEDQRLFEITQFLQRAAKGDEEAIEELVPLVYDEMHGLAHAGLRKVRVGSSFETSDLLHESWSRLLSAKGAMSFENRRHFYGAAARAMRNILIEQLRKDGSLKRDVKRNEPIAEDMPEVKTNFSLEEAIDIGNALDRLMTAYPRQGEVAWQRVFNQIPMKAIAEVLGISENTAGRDWRFARAWLQDALGSLFDDTKIRVSDGDGE